ncbi:zinc ribbon domain-containing protein [Holdemanella biformis]|uniref:zinc ribbon domain-containing protein n=1 Tax=Holdemanella biformis TaxID=1735 RepID=UPI0039F45149
MALKISELTKKEQEAILKDKNLVPCSNCGNIVQKSDNYCGSCGKRLFLTVSLKPSTNN